MANYTDFAGSVAQDLAGDVLQVKEVEHRYASGHITRTNATVLDLTDLAITITPKYADSKIYGEMCLPMSRMYGSCVQLYRAGSGVTDGAMFVPSGSNSGYYYGLAYMSVGDGQWSTNNLAWLDTTYNTTEAITYTPQVRSWTTYSTAGYYVHQGNQMLHRIYEIKT